GTDPNRREWRSNRRDPFRMAVGRSAPGRSRRFQPHGGAVRHAPAKPLRRALSGRRRRRGPAQGRDAASGPRLFCDPRGADPRPERERDRSSDRRRSPAGALRDGLLGALVLVALAGLPGAAFAGLAPPETADDGILGRSLLEVREQLDRRLASQRRAQASVSRLSAEIEELRARLAETTAMLQATREEALALERRLDRLVPRLLARTAELEERRAQAGKALADLAAKERGAGLEPTTRARLSALGPLMLQRLRAAEAEVDALRQGRERTLERQARIERRLAALASERRHLERLRVETLGLRQSALARLHGLEAEVAVLAETETRLARRVLRAEAASVALGDPGPDAPASRAAPAFRSALAALSASVGKGALAANRSLETGGESLPESYVVAQAPAARDPGELEPGAGPVARIGPPRAALHGDGSAALPGDHAEGTGGASSVDVVYQPEGGLSDAEV